MSAEGGFRIEPPHVAGSPIVAHVPHSSTVIPPEVRAGLLLDDVALANELVRLTDWHTDDLYAWTTRLGATRFINEFSRLVVDPERFPDDAAEPMARVGQGAVYVRSTDGRVLRDPTAAQRDELLERYFRPYHHALTDLVGATLDRFGRCLLLDCHSFASVSLPSELDHAHLADADRAILLVSASDKLHNARAIVGDLRTVGDQLWRRFNAPRDETLWYYRALVDVYRMNPAHVPALIDELDRTVTEMERLASVASSEVTPGHG